MIAATLRFLIAAFVAGSYALGGATFTNQRVTTQAPPAGDCTGLPPAVTSFLTAQGSVYLFFDATVATTDSLTNDWLAPDGTVVAGSGWSPVSGDYCFDNAPSLAISNLPTSQIGAWQARVWDDGTLLFSVPFTVSAPPAGQVTVLGDVTSTSSGIANNDCTTPPLVTAFTPASPSVYIYFDVTGAVVGDSARANFYAPDGALYTSEGWSSFTPGANGYECFSDSIAISGASAASDTGVWSISVVWDNSTTPLFTLNFTIAAVSAPVISSGGVVNGASFTAGPVVPGSIVSIFGTALASGTAQAPANSPPTTLQSTQVLMNGIAAPLFYISPTQINAEVPWEVSGLFVTDLTVQVISNGAQSNVVSAPLAATAPGIFAVVHNADNTLVTSAKPAVPGEYLVAYCTGLGTVTNQPPTGTAAPMSPLSYTAQNSTVTIGGLSAYVPFSGLAPGFTGLYQVDAQVPASVASASAAPLVLSIGGASTTVAIAVQSAGVQQFTLTRTTAGNGSGSISANPLGPSYPAGTVVTLTATSNTGSTFAGWSGACSGTGTCTVTMNSNQAVTATFNLTATTGPAITSLSTTSPLPLTPLLINTSGVDPNSPISLQFSDASGFSVTESPIRVSADGSVMVVGVPLYVNPNTGQTGPDAMSLVLTQGGQSAPAVTVNVQDLPAVSAYGAQPGQISHAVLILEAMMIGQRINQLQAFQSLPGNTVDTTQAQGTLAQLLSSAIMARSDVDSVTSGPSTVMPTGIALSNGSPVQFDQTALDMMDRINGLLLSQVFAAASQSTGSVAGGPAFFSTGRLGRLLAPAALPAATLTNILSTIDLTANTPSLLQGMFAAYENNSFNMFTVSDYAKTLSQQISNGLALASLTTGNKVLGAYGAIFGILPTLATCMGSDAAWIRAWATGDTSGMAAAESAMQQGQADVYAALASVVAAGVGGQACEQLGSQCVGVLKQIATVLETPTAGLSTIAGLVAAYVNLQESWGSDKIAPIDLQSIPLSNTAPPSSPSQGIATVNGTITVANQGISTPQAGASLCGFGGDSTRCVTGIGDGSGNYALYVPLQVAGTDYGNLTMNAIDPLSGVSLGSETVDLTDLTSSAPGQIPPIAAEAPLSFNAGGLPDATAGVPYPAFSFCTPAPTGTTALCGVPPTTNPSGGQPPYHFQLGSGGFPPIGMSLNLNGLLTGTPTAAGTASFTVCAVDLSATSVCQPVSLTVNPAASSYSTLTVTYAGTGAGTASPSSSPAGIPCGTNCWSYAADTNTAVTLTETPNIGSTFAGWSGACSGMGTTCAVTMGTNQAVTATFNLAAGDSVTPSSVTLGSAGGCAGGSLSGSVNVTAAPGVTWDAYLGGAASFSPVVTFQPVSGTLIIGAYGAVSGSGSGVVTFAVNPPPQSPSYGYTCNYTTNVQESDTLVVENFSDYGSPEVFVPVSWTWIQVD